MFDSLLRRRPGHATVVAYLALFAALGGSSYAALRIGSGQIVNNSVRSKDVRNNDIRSKDVRNRSLLAKGFKPGQLPSGQKGDTGTVEINEIIPSEETVVPGTVTVRAYENEPTADEWGVTAFAFCANVS